jgi:hypothetical protein
MRLVVEFNFGYFSQGLRWSVTWLRVVYSAEDSVPPNPRNAQVSKPKRTLKVPTGYFEYICHSESHPYGELPV